MKQKKPLRVKAAGHEHWYSSECRTGVFKQRLHANIAPNHNGSKAYRFSSVLPMQKTMGQLAPARGSLFAYPHLIKAPKRRCID